MRCKVGARSIGIQCVRERAVWRMLARYDTDGAGLARFAADHPVVAHRSIMRAWRANSIAAKVRCAALRDTMNVARALHVQSFLQKYPSRHSRMRWSLLLASLLVAPLAAGAQEFALQPTWIAGGTGSGTGEYGTPES